MPKKGQIETEQKDAKPKGYASGIPVYCAFDKIVPISELKPNPLNPNKHPQEQIQALGRIIREGGWRKPITVSTRSGMITAGHGRLMAAQLEELKEAPVDYQDYASEAASSQI
jgi:ParB-like chromosome segregation protein Spo0J